MLINTDTPLYIIITNSINGRWGWGCTIHPARQQSVSMQDLSLSLSGLLMSQQVIIKIIITIKIIIIQLYAKLFPKEDILQSLNLRRRKTAHASHSSQSETQRKQNRPNNILVLDSLKCIVKHIYVTANMDNQLV